MNLNKFGETLENRILLADQEAGLNGLVLSPKTIEIRVVGQASLLADTFLGMKLELEQTHDFDAFVKAAYPIESILRNLLQEYGFSFDNLSEQIWMPEDTVWEKCFEGDFVIILKARAIDVLVSKAIKAPVKNRKLVVDALDIYGDELIGRIQKYGGNLENFKRI